jgi:hypothetical protein
MIAGVMLVGVVMAISVSTDAAGGLAAMVPLITVLLTLLAWARPKAGLYGLAALCIWVDEFKRLAVYFGGAYSMTVVQILAMPFIVLAAMNAGFLLNLMFRKVQIDRIGVILYVLGAVIGITVFYTVEGGVAVRAQRAANIAGYMTLMPIVYTYLTTFDDWRRFFSFQAILALPAAAWAIKQYYFGFDQIEWVYVHSGLSRVHSGQMLAAANPRVFGFFGSASALGCVSIYCAYAWWHGCRFRSRRLLWFVAAMIFTWVLVASTQRTALFYPLIVLLFAYSFRTFTRTIVIYSLVFSLFISGVIFSDYLLDKGLDNVNRVIETNSNWGGQVLKVSTFSDRLRGWQRLKRLKSWSLFGTQEEVFSTTTVGFDVNSENYNHDVINKILINYGIVGMLVILIPSLSTLHVLHRTAYQAGDLQDRNDAAFTLALSFPIILLSMVGGDNFNTNPINLQIWTAIAGVFVCRNTNLLFHRQATVDELQSKASPSLTQAAST